MPLADWQRWDGRPIGGLASGHTGSEQMAVEGEFAGVFCW